MNREPSHLQALLRLLVRAVRDRAEPRPAGTPGRRLAVERRGIEVDPRRVAAYRRVTGAAEAPAGSPLPPTYPAVWETALALDLLASPGLPLPTRGLIHVESELCQLRPLHADDQMRCRVELDGAEAHPQGMRLTLAGRTWNGAGQLCVEDSLVLLARLPGRSHGDGRAPRAGPTPTPADGWRELEAWRLPAGQGRRYARVSGDFNPIHLWSWSSRPFGFSRPILHGFCLEAMVANALIRHIPGGDPTGLRRLRAAFLAPLPLPARVRLEVSPTDSAAGRFRVMAGGRRPVAEGDYVGNVEC